MDGSKLKRSTLRRLLVGAVICLAGVLLRWGGMKEDKGIEISESIWEESGSSGESTGGGSSGDDRGSTGQEASVDESREEVPAGVHVSGAVVHPDHVWLLPEGSRVEDAILAAGGPSEEADLSGLNLAAHIFDGERIYVPTFQETLSWGETGGPELTSGGWDGDGGSYGTGVGGAAGEEENGSPHLTNLNTASKMELIELPGIGEAYAQRIIAYREEHGPFQSVEDIMNVSGIGEATFAKLKDLITVGQ